MGFFSGTVEVGDGLTPLCTVPETGVLVRNKGGSVIYLGGGDLPDDGTGYPLEPGTSEMIQGVRPRPSVAVPAPPGDMVSAVLYVRTDLGAGHSWVSFITVS